MSSDFQIVPLDKTPFEHLFAMTDEELEGLGAVRQVVDAVPGYPCRVSLQDRPLGEETVLIHYQHQSGDSPYRAAGPIYVGRHTEPAELDVNRVPEFFLHRLLSVRAYDRAHMMVDAEVVNGKELSKQLREFFEKDEVAYQHVHFARPGCFACLVNRV